MPTYEYRCQACDHRFDLYQSIKAHPIRKCPKCAKLKVRRLISGGGGLIFKGSGFYITDYRSEGYRKAAGADSPSKASADSPSKSDSSADKGVSAPAKPQADAPTKGKPTQAAE